MDVILPLPLPNPFTYRVPNELQNQVIIGGRVVVPFGSRKIHTGIIKEPNVQKLAEALKNSINLADKMQ